MKYPKEVYEVWSAFYASTLSEAEKKVNTYNFLVSQLTGITPKDINTSLEGLNIASILIGKVGWVVFLSITALLAAGYLGFLGGMGALIATNPLLAAALVLIGGGGSILLIWKHRKVLFAARRVGKIYKSDFQTIVKKFDSIDAREQPINSLHYKCVIEIVEAVFNVNMEENLRDDTD